MAARQSEESSGTKESSRGGGSPGRSRASGTPRPTDHQEIEWQFDVVGLEPAEGRLAQHSSGLAVDPESTQRITDTYYDTDNSRFFYRAGYALRVRETEWKDFEKPMGDARTSQDEGSRETLR